MTIFNAPFGRVSPQHLRSDAAVASANRHQLRDDEADEPHPVRQAILLTLGMLVGMGVTLGCWW